MIRYRWVLSATLAIAGANGASAQSTTPQTTSTSSSGGILSSLTSLFKTRSVENPSASTNSAAFSNASSNVGSVSTTPGMFTRLYRAVWSPDTAAAPKRASSYSYPAGFGQSNNLQQLGPALPINGTTTYFPIPTTPGALSPVLPKSSTVSK